jgi:hypothetical protein
LTVLKDGSGSGTVRSESEPKIDCGAICSGTAYGGAVVTLRAIPNAGSVFTGWSGSCGGIGDCVVTMTQDRSVRATFARGSAPTRGKRHLRVRVAGAGRVASSPSGLDCGRACAASFDDGATIVLLAKPARGWRFSGWGDPCGSAGKPTSCVLRLRSDTSVAATFRRASCLVPKVTGKSLRHARRALRRAGCRIGRVRRVYSRRFLPARIASQKPRAGARRPSGWKVRLAVSRGPRA